MPLQKNKPGTLEVLLATPLPPPEHGGVANWTRIIRRELGTRPSIELTFVDTAARYRAGTNTSLWLRLFGGSAQAIRDTYRVYRRLKADPPDVFHLNTSAGPATLKDILMLRIARRYRVPGVIHYQMGKALYTVPGSKLEWKLMRCAMASAHAVATGDKRGEACVKAALPNQLVVTLPNMVEIDVIDKIRGEEDSRPSARENRLRIVFVGFVVPRKGVRELVKACARLPHDAFVLDLVGPVARAMRRELESIASDSGNTDWLCFHGGVDHDQALRHILAADVFTLPSHGETAPNAVLEAMGCGRAIVCSTIAAMPEMLDFGGPQECGVCVEPGDVDALSSALNELLRDEAKRRELGRKARARAERLYAAPVACGRLLDLWKSVAK